jgi:hypothetical protein
LYFALRLTPPSPMSTEEILVFLPFLAAVLLLLLLVPS